MPELETPDLIPALPHDVARHCLLKAPLAAHAKLRQVSRAWRDLADIGPDYYAARAAGGYSVQYACLIQSCDPPPCLPKTPLAYGVTIWDPTQSTWHNLPPPLPYFPTLPLFCHCLSAGTRIYLVGGWDPATWAPLPSVLIYDLATCRWTRGADMPTQTSFFACAAFPDGSIAVAGGHDVDKNALRSAFIYLPASDTWQLLPIMNLPRDECKGVVVDGKFTVISGFATESQGQFCRSAERYNTVTEKWELLDKFWPSAAPPSSAVVAGGRLLALLDGKLMRYKNPGSKWEVFEELPAELTVPACAAAVGDGILVSGYSGGFSGLPYEACLWRFSDRRGQRRWRRVQPGEGFTGVAQSACTVQV